MERKFWICWEEYSLDRSFRYFDLVDAKKEAERLLRLPDNIDKKVFILESVLYCDPSDPLYSGWQDIVSV